MAGLVSDLRRTVADPRTPPALRDAAARRLSSARQRVGRRPPARAAGRPGHVVGHPRAPPVSATRPRCRPAGAAVGQHADSLWPVPDEVLPGPRGRWGRPLRTSRPTSADRARARRARRHRRARRRPDDADALMAHVDAVWHRLEFRTPWAAAREHDRVRTALARFLAWHHSNTRSWSARRPLRHRHHPRRRRGCAWAASPTGWRSTTTAASSSSTSRPARTSRPTSRCRPTPARHLPVAVDHGGFEEIAPRTPPPAAPSCVQLRALDEGLPTVRAAPGRPGRRRPRAAVLPDAAGRGRRLPATRGVPRRPGEHCNQCAFISLCPAKSAGSVGDPDLLVARPPPDRHPRRPAGRDEGATSPSTTSSGEAITAPLDPGRGDRGRGLGQDRR